MLDNPYLIIRIIIILSAVAYLIYRFEVIMMIIDLIRGQKTNPDEEINKKVEELLNKRGDKKS
jgi:hypothetical protein